MTRTLDDGMRSILQRMHRATLWKMAREIGADSTQYAWLLRHGFIVRRDAQNYGTSHRWEYRLTRAGEAEAQPTCSACGADLVTTEIELGQTVCTGCHTATAESEAIHD